MGPAGLILVATVLSAVPFSSSADTVHGRAYTVVVQDWQGLPADVQPFTRYLIAQPLSDRLAVSLPPTLVRPDTTFDVVSFWVNALSSTSTITRPTPVYWPGAAPHVYPAAYRLDIRDYGWTVEAWEQVVREYPYTGGIGRTVGGLLAVRADWFIAETSDATRSTAYYRLLYTRPSNKAGGGSGKSGGPSVIQPATAGDFRERWGVDLKGVRAFGVETGAVIKSGESIVALHNRVLARAPTILGSYWQTFDAVDDTGDRNYLEKLQGFKFDAQEHIVSLPNGLHAYLLSNAVGARQEEAPANVARDPTLPSGDARVRTPRSCVTCHGAHDGLHPPRNAVRRITTVHGESGKVDLYAKDKAYQLWLKAFYLTEDGKRLLDDQRNYAQAVDACNGLSSKANSELYLKALTVYENPLTLTDVAREVGQTPETCKAALLPTAQGNLGALVTGKAETISRRQLEKDYYGQVVTLLQVYLSQGAKK